MILLFTLVLLVLPLTFASGAEVKNVTARQVTNRVIFEYDLVGKPGDRSNVEISVIVHGKMHQGKDLHLEGDYGPVAPGKGKKICWNILQDFKNGYDGTVEWEIGVLPSRGGGKQRDALMGMEFIFVRGGCSPLADPSGNNRTLGGQGAGGCVDDFYVARQTVTVGEFRRFVKATGYRTDAEKGSGCSLEGAGSLPAAGLNWRNPGVQQYDDQPVVCVSWNDSMAFLLWLSRTTGKKYRLPREAEWAYALDYVQAGNMGEWVFDRPREDSPVGVTGGQGTEDSGQNRIVRGTSRGALEAIPSASGRYALDPSACSPSLGFRTCFAANE
jgi:hypothetical protein